MKYLIYLLLLASFPMMGQQTPAPPQSQPIAIKGGTIHIGNGTAIENGLILFRDGKIERVTAIDQTTEADLSQYQVIDGTGKDIYPGFIAPNTTLGLSEIAAVGATNDGREIGYFNPSIRSIIAYNTDSRVTPTVRSNGVLLAQIKPRGGRISGQSSIIELDGWNWEDAVYKIDEGIFLNWPDLFSWSWNSGSPEQKKDDKYNEKIRELEDYLTLAKAYAQQLNPETTNLKFEAMRGLFDGSKQLYVQVDMAKSIMETVVLCQKMELSPIIVGGEEAWRVADFLAESKVRLILGKTQSLPALEDDDIDQPFKNAKILTDAGVLYCFSDEGFWQQRNLPFQAGQAVAYGLDYEKAVMGVTLNTAKILGVDQTVGSLEKGKDATLFICQGDALDMRTNKITQAFIRGKNIDLDNKQKALYRKFSEKYNKK